jgi:hypothetical protein
MYKDYSAQPWEDEIGLSGQVFAMKAKTIAKAMNECAHEKLRFRIGRTYALHIPTSLRGRQIVHYLIDGEVHIVSSFLKFVECNVRSSVRY